LKFTATGEGDNMGTLHTFILGTAFGSVAALGVVYAAEPGGDPVTISPQLYTVRLENDRVRALEYRLKPGGTEPMHSHTPGVVYTFADGMLRSTSPDGKVTDVPLKAGAVTWREFTTHALANIGTTEVHTFAIELKPCT
jgi:hypothetical protein